MKRSLALVLFLILSAGIFAQDQLKENFRKAPDCLPGERIPLKGMPLWHTNGPLNSQQIQEFFELGKKNGFGGYTFLPLGKTTPKHLTPEYIRYFGEVLDCAKKNDMKVIFYDDIDFPSGSAGKTIHQKLPQHTIKRLDKIEWTVTGPKEFREKIEIKLTDKIVYGSPAGVLQGAVALNLKDFRRIDLTGKVKDGVIEWSVPKGKWKILIFVCLADPHVLVDYMSPEAVREFIKLTYEPFYQKFPQHFGSTIPMCFFDDITNTQTLGSRNWTLGFGKRYRELWNRNPVLDYPALFYPIGKETVSARYRLWTTRNLLFAEGYPKVVHQWCRDHNILSTGHPQGPYVIEPIDMSGDAMLSHEFSDYVLFDSIHYYGHGRDGFKIPTSAAYNLDMPICVVEIYGNYRPKTFDDKMMYRSAMEIFARGGNFLLPHGIWSDPATVYIPPEISWRNPDLKGCLPEYGKFVSRCSLLLRGGRHVADLGMIYPIDNMKAFFHFQFDFIKGDYRYGTYLPPETDYLAIGSDLSTKIYRDWTLLHPKFVDQKCVVVKNEEGTTLLRLNNKTNREEYEVICLTGAEVISWTNMKKVLDFYRAGGKVLATTYLPARSVEGDADEKVRAAVKEIFGVDPNSQIRSEALKTGQEDITLPQSFRNARKINEMGQPPVSNEGKIAYKDPVRKKKAVFLPRPTTELLERAMNDLMPVPDVRIVPLPGTTMPELTVVPRWDYPIQGMFQYIHKIKEGRNIYYFANSSDSGTTFQTELRGEFPKLEIWDPNSGQIKKLDGVQISVKNGVTITSFRLDLPPVKSLFIVEGK